VTEGQWLGCVDHQALLGFLQGRASDRELRLFGAEQLKHLIDRGG